jgi:hypothetical protein
VPDRASCICAKKNLSGPDMPPAGFNIQLPSIGQLSPCSVLTAMWTSSKAAATFSHRRRPGRRLVASERCGGLLCCRKNVGLPSYDVGRAELRRDRVAA